MISTGHFLALETTIKRILAGGAVLLGVIAFLALLYIFPILLLLLVLACFIGLFISFAYIIGMEIYPDNGDPNDGIS